MAKRYGGRFSPQATKGEGDHPLPARATPGKARHPLESRPKWVTIAATPLLLSAFFQSPLLMATSLAGFGLIALAMHLTRDGLRAQAAYDARRTARRPALPRKLIGGVLAGVGLAVGAFQPDAIGGAAIIGIAGVVLHWLAFGPDPMRDKGMEGIDSFQQDRAARIVAEGENHLRAMRDAILRTGDRRLEARVQMFSVTARELFARIEENPDDLGAARRYLGVYLMGARDATVKFADLYAQTRDAQARQDYETLLDDLDTNFAARTGQLIAGNRADLDIEMQVLSDRLAREGVRTDPNPRMIGQDYAAVQTAVQSAIQSGNRD